MVRVLVVDDDPSVVQFLSVLLTSNGFEVLAADTVRRGIETLEQHNVGAGLVDLRLPDASGIELIRARRQKGDYTPFVIVTGHGSVAAAVVYVVSPDVARSYRFGGTPQTILVSPAGTIVKNWKGAYQDSLRTSIEKDRGVRLTELLAPPERPSGS